QVDKKFPYQTHPNRCRAEIELEDSGEKMHSYEGFSCLQEMELILTHPVQGYFSRRDGQLGSYSVWHGKMNFTRARATRLYFSLFEDLGLLTREEMMKPHSIFVCPETVFEILLPPRKVD
ncbi:MAG: hypothetical protein ACR2H1_13120, partial [Limisphaerales bacterium]